MSPGPESGSVREYVAVLRGIGLTESAIADVHDLERSEGELLNSIADRLEDVSEVDRWAALTDAIATSPRGIDVPLSYWNHAPEVHLEELLAPYGCSIQIEPTRRASSLAAGSYVIRLTDAAGTEYWTRFEYPDSELAEDNYPSLLHHVQTELLDGAGLRIVRLTAPPSRWRFALLTHDQLAALQRRYGERVEVFGGPVLATNQPDAFATEEPPIPPAYEASEGSQSGDTSRFGQARPSIERSSASSLDELPADAADAPEEDGDEIDLEFHDESPSPEGIVASVEQANAGAASTAAVTGETDVEASDEELETMFGDLSKVSLEPEDPDPEPSTGDAGTAVSIDGGTVTDPQDADDADPLDDLFQTIKRDVADSDPEPDRAPDAGRETSISDLVSGVADDGAPDRADDREPREGTEAVPTGAADLTASELFTDLGERE